MVKWLPEPRTDTPRPIQWRWKYFFGPASWFDWVSVNDMKSRKHSFFYDIWKSVWPQFPDWDMGIPTQKIASCSRSRKFIAPTIRCLNIGMKRDKNEVDKIALGIFVHRHGGNPFWIGCFVWCLDVHRVTRVQWPYWAWNDSPKQTISRKRVIEWDSL